MNWILGMVAGAAVLTDLSKGKIYNILVFPAMAAGVLLHIWSEGISAFPHILLSLLVPFLLLLPFWLLGSRGIAAGDIKLFMAISTLMDLSSFFTVFALAFGIGAVISVFVLLKTHDFRRHIHFALPIGISVLFYLGGLF